MSQCIRERPKRSILHNRTSNTGGQGLNRQSHDGGAEAPWQLHAPRRKTLTVGTKIGRDRSLDRAVLPRLSKGLSLEGRASRAPEARRAAGARQERPCTLEADRKGSESRPLSLQVCRLEKCTEPRRLLQGRCGLPARPTMAAMLGLLVRIW